jgi:YVTN family beta-propeller protein
MPYSFYARLFCLALPALLLPGCTHTGNTDTAPQPNLSVTYPAAFVVNAESNSLSVINLTTQQVAATVSFGEASAPHTGTHTGDAVAWPHHVYLSPDGSKLGVGVPGMDLSAGHTGATAGMKGRVLLLDAKTGNTLQNLPTPVMNHNAVFSPDGTELWTSQMGETGSVLVYNAATMMLKNTIAVGKEPAEVTIAANGQYAFVANGGSNGKMYVDNEAGKSISVIDVATLAVVETVPLGFTPGYAAYNAARNELWVTQAGTGRKVVIFEFMGGAWMKHAEIETGLDAHAIAFTTDGRTAYITNQGAATVSVVDVNTRTKLRDIAVGKKPNGLVIKQ